ncbi:tRNA(His) guanylyltransferase [Sarracenia purpurea var. burkii]
MQFFPAPQITSKSSKLLLAEPNSPVLISGRFSEAHEFEKPNDGNALNLMNSCAVDVLEEFQDIVFPYGVNDEYRFHTCF